MVIRLNNTCEDTDGQTVTTGHFGAPNPFDSSGLSGVGATSAFSSTHAYAGSTSIKGHSAAAVACSTWVAWNTTSITVGATDAYDRFFLYLTAYPVANERIASFLTTAGALNCSLQVTTTGQLRTANSTGVTVATTTGVMPLNAWVRVEFEQTGQVTTTATVSARFFSGANIETGTPDTNGAISTNAVTVVGAAQQTRIGFNNFNETPAFDYWMDAVAYSDGIQPGATTNGTASDAGTAGDSLNVDGLRAPAADAGHGADTLANAVTLADAGTGADSLAHTPIVVTDRGLATVALGVATSAVATSASFTPAAGAMLAILTWEYCATSPTAGVVTDTFGDVSGTAWVESVATPANTGPFSPLRITMWTRRVGFGATSGAVSFRQSSDGVSLNRNVQMETLELSGADLPRQSAASTNTITGGLAVSLPAAPNADAVVLSSFEGRDVAAVPVMPSRFVPLLDIATGANTDGRAGGYAGGGSATTVTWAPTFTSENYALVLELPAAKILPDAGSAADLLAASSASFTVGDAGSGTDSLTKGDSTILLGDAGSGADDLTLGTPIPLAEAGRGADTLEVTKPVDLPEAGSGTDTLMIGISLGDAGSDTDAAPSTITALLPDAGTGSDGITVDTGGTTASRSLIDAGRSADTLEVTKPVPLLEAGRGKDLLTTDQPGGPGVVWSVANDGADTHPTFTWTVFPRPAYGDFAVLVLQIKAGLLADTVDGGAAATSFTDTLDAGSASTSSWTDTIDGGSAALLASAITNDGGFSLLETPVDSPAGSALQVIFTKTCDGTETGPVTFTLPASVIWVLVAVGCTNGKLDSTHYAQADNGPAALTDHPTVESTASGPAQILSIFGGRPTVRDARPAPLTAPSGTQLVVQRAYVPAANIPGESAGIASAVQGSSGPTVTGNWSTDPVGYYSVTGVLVVVPSRSSNPTVLSGTGASAGALTVKQSSNLTATGTGASTGTLTGTLTQSTAKTDVDAGHGVDTLKVARSLPAALPGTGASTGTLAVTVQHGFPMILTGAARTTGKLAVTLKSHHRWDVPDVHGIDDPEHVPDHQQLVTVLTWLDEQFPRQPVSGGRKWG